MISFKKIEKKFEKKPDKEREEILFPRDEVKEKERSFEKEREKERFLEEIGKIKISSQERKEAKTQAKKLEKEEKNEEEIINDLWNLAEKKGIGVALETAKKLNNPRLLDLFHDFLVEDERYKKVLK